MKILYLKDRNRRFFYNQTEKKKHILRYIFNNLKLENSLRIKAYSEYTKICMKSSITLIKNRCILTNRSKGIYRKFKISRLFFKKYALSGDLPGIRKASW